MNHGDIHETNQKFFRSFRYLFIGALILGLLLLGATIYAVYLLFVHFGVIA